MFCSAGDNVLATIAVSKTVAFNSKVISLSRATSKDYFVVGEFKDI